jgi:hypothetical protein
MSQHPIESKRVPLVAVAILVADNQVHSRNGRLAECRDRIGHYHQCARCDTVAWLYIPLRQNATRAIRLRSVPLAHYEGLD